MAAETTGSSSSPCSCRTRRAKLLSDAFVDGEPQQPSRRPDRNELLDPPAGRHGSRTARLRSALSTSGRARTPVESSAGAARCTSSRLRSPGCRRCQSRWTLYLPPSYRYLGFRGCHAREASDGRGWDRFRRRSESLCAASWADSRPARLRRCRPIRRTLPAAKSAGFDTQLQIEGMAVVLRRLGEPAPVAVSVSSQSVGLDHGGARFSARSGWRALAARRHAARPLPLLHGFWFRGADRGGRPRSRARPGFGMPSIWARWLHC